MKNIKLFVAVLLVLVIILAAVSCKKDIEQNGKIELGLADGASLNLTVGEEGVDFTKFFKITVDGKSVDVTIDMLDLSKVDLTKEGTFEVTLTYGGKNFTATFTVVAAGGDDPVVDTTDIKAILKSYEDVSKWNFVVNLAVSYDGELEYEEEFSQLGNILRYAHLNENDDTDSTVYVDYVKYLSDDCYIHYGDLGDGLYQMTTIDEDSYGYIYFPMLYVNYLSACDFKEVDNHYEALNPQDCGDNVYGYADGCTYTKVELYVEDGKITKIVFFSDEEYDGDIYKGEAVFELSGYGTVDFDISNLEIVYGDTDSNPEELKEVFAKYEDESTWNFAIDILLKQNGTAVATMAVGYEGWNSYLKQVSDDVRLTDYLVYDEESGLTWYLLDNGDGTHTKYTEEDLMFYFLYYYMSPLAIYDLGNHVFVKVGDHYEAKYPEVAGDNLYGADESCVYTKVELYVANGLIEKIVLFADIEGSDEDGDFAYNEETVFEFGNYGKITVDISGLEIVEDNGGDNPFPDEPVENPAELQAIFDRLADMENWNFAIRYEEIEDGMMYSEDYEYFKYIAVCKYVDVYGDYCLDYLSYDPITQQYTLWLLDVNGSYVQLTDDEEDFYDYFYDYYFVDLSILSFFEFEKIDGFYAAKDPDAVGGYFIGYYEGTSWSTFIITIANGNIKTIEATLDDGTVIRYTFSKYGEIELELPDENGNGGNEDGDGLTSTFVGADLSVGSGEMGYTANKAARDLDPNRGLQFLQENGTVVLVSKSSVNGVLSVTVVVSTNADKGMIVSVRVGGVDLTYDGQTTFLLEKSNNVTLTFVSDVALSGKVEVTLTSTQTNKSMYIKSISIVKEEGGDEPDNPDDGKIEIGLADGVSLTLLVGDDVDFTKFFKITEDGKNVQVTIDMLDLSQVDLTKEGNFDVKLSYGGKEYTAIFVVVSKYDDPDITDKSSLTSTFVGKDLSVGSGEIEYTSNIGASSLDKNRGLQFMQENGKVNLTSKVSVSNVYAIELVVNTNADAGMDVSVKVGGVALTSGGQTSVFVAKHNYTENVNLTFTSSNALSGQVEVTLTPKQTKNSMYIKSITIVREAGSGENPNPNPTVMEKQKYDPKTFDHENLQDKMMKVDDCIGLPSVGDINVLVVPVQFAGDTITAKDLEKLNIAFNGTSAQTGWESVKTFYSKSSYGKLNLTFDIQTVFEAPQNATYYENYKKRVNYEGSYYYELGDTLILTQVLAYLEPLIDLTKYDSNNDGVIDAVYLIYSAPVNYESDDSLFWAFTAWYGGEEYYDDLWAYSYLFAGFDFMDEDYGTNGMKVNAETYIHETGHLLGLDDYYDYKDEVGCNLGLGGADMMDFNHGDHGAFSKIMLGWTDATIVDSTATLTIGNLVSTGDCILIPLNFNNSYFSEYLLIDLYSASSLNAYASEALYDGASYGVRIYHVTAWARNPYENEYGSFTDYNNTDTEFALIRLIEADGEYDFNSTEDCAAASDLWQAGDSLSKVFSTFTRNDGKLVNFDITINSVSNDEASITITFKD